MKKLLVVALASSVVLTSCVSKKKYTELENTNSSLQQEVVDTKAALQECGVNVEKKDLKIASLQDELAFKVENYERTAKQAQDLSLLTSQNMQKTLEEMGKANDRWTDVNDALAHKDSLNMALVLNLKGALADINDNDIEINVEKGVVFVSISDKLLFNSGSYAVSSKAIDVLGKVATVVNDKPSFEILVEGHTDNKLVKDGAAIKDNWELSVQRAAAVVRVLTDKYEVAPERITAAGRSSYVPVADNDTKEGRAKNRRTKIILLPQLDEFYNLLETK
ncbi:MAG: OmpA/MotB family protein [Flavobacteriaceae bacterium]